MVLPHALRYAKRAQRSERTLAESRSATESLIERSPGMRTRPLLLRVVFANALLAAFSARRRWRNCEPACFAIGRPEYQGPWTQRKPALEDRAAGP